jgi:uncharacterized damage-inducible protein DinB
METKAIERIKEQLNAAFHGAAWHGPSVLEVVKDIKPKLAANRVQNVHTIAELVYHITSWRIFAAKRIQGDEEYEVKTMDEFEWETLTMELALSHDELMLALEEKADKFLDEIVVGTEYDYYTLLNGIIQHDLYHTGQMAILKKMKSKKLQDEEDEDGHGKSSRYFNDEFGDDY